MVEKIFNNMIDAIVSMHLDYGMRHGDLKPSNVVVDRDMNIQLIDFGSASFYDAQEDKYISFLNLYEKATTRKYRSPFLILRYNKAFH